MDKKKTGAITVVNVPIVWLSLLAIFGWGSIAMLLLIVPCSVVGVILIRLLMDWAYKEL